VSNHPTNHPIKNHLGIEEGPKRIVRLMMPTVRLQAITTCERSETREFSGRNRMSFLDHHPRFLLLLPHLHVKCVCVIC
jgi:hypothetical protein